ncbi:MULTISPECIES: OsmC family protein [Aphanothece]|uniref:OsmC family protein n=1 Tax=Aphanothece TaxID=1121 RepID=UPI003984D732
MKASHGAGQDFPDREGKFVMEADESPLLLESVESALVGDLDLRGFLGLDPDARKGYKIVSMEMHITGALSEAQEREVMGLGCTYSPVFSMMSPGVPISVDLVA